MVTIAFKSSGRNAKAKKMAGIETVLNKESARFVEMVDALALDRLRTRYTFMDADERRKLRNRDPGEGMRIYWQEMLGRAHVTSVTTMLRNRCWLDAVVSATVNSNLLAFAAAFRGFVESTADAATALFGTPLTLAHIHPTISESLVGRSRVVVESTDLENAFIHFSHARYIKRSEETDTLTSHIARSAREYANVFGDRFAVERNECYRFLSDLTHPAAPSVWMWLAPVGEKRSEFELSTNQHEAIISSFLEQYEALFRDLTYAAFNTPVLVLHMLNYFSIKELHTAELLNWNLDGIPAWRKCKDALEANGVQLSY